MNIKLPSEEELARVIFEQIHNCKIRDPNSNFHKDSGPKRAARAVLVLCTAALAP